MNRADPVLLEYMKYHIDNVDPSKGETYEKAKKFGQILIDNCELPVLSSLYARAVGLATGSRWKLDGTNIFTWQCNLGRAMADI